MIKGGTRLGGWVLFGSARGHPGLQYHCFARDGAWVLYRGEGKKSKERRPLLERKAVG